MTTRIMRALALLVAFATFTTSALAHDADQPVQGTSPASCTTVWTVPVWMFPAGTHTLTWTVAFPGQPPVSIPATFTTQAWTQTRVPVTGQAVVPPGATTMTIRLHGTVAADGFTFDRSWTLTPPVCAPVPAPVEPTPAPQPAPSPSPSPVPVPEIVTGAQTVIRTTPTCTPRRPVTREVGRKLVGSRIRITIRVSTGCATHTETRWRKAVPRRVVKRQPQVTG